MVTDLQEIMITHLGELCALATALVWAFSVILFKKSGEFVRPVALNTFKSTLAMLLLVPTLYLWGDSLFHPAPARDYALLFLSGAVGVAVADSLFFKSLNLLGAGLSAIVDCLYSPFIILLSVTFLSERLGWLQIVGVLMIISAVLTATGVRGRGTVPRGDLVRGAVWGALAMALMAIAIVMVKPILDRSPLLWATEIRLMGGCLVLYVQLLIRRRKDPILRTLLTAHSWKYTVLGSFLGAYVAMVLWIAGMKYTQASTAAALNQTSNVFVFLFAALFLKEKITPAKLIAIAAAVTGVFLVTFG